MNQCNRLSDILKNGNRDQIAAAWTNTQAAGDFIPLPAGEYIAHVHSGDLFTSRQNATPGYKLTFKVCEGEHAGRLVWDDLWLTKLAMPMTKRDLGKLGVTALEQLEQPLPQGIRCKVKLALRRDDDGSEHNRVRSFEVLGIDPPEAEPFAPADGGQGDDGNGATVALATPDDEGQGDDDSAGAALPTTPGDGIPI